LEKYGIDDVIKNKIIEEYTIDLVPPGTKGVIRGNKFNNIVKEYIENLSLNPEVYEVCFEKNHLTHTTSEIPDWYILHKETNKILIGMNQLDLWGGGHQTNRGSKYQKPFATVVSFVENTPTVVSATTMQGYYFLNNYLNSTVPFSGSSSPYTQIPSLSALTCNNFTSIGTSSGGGIQQFVSVYHYRVELTDPNNVKSFRILASPIVNGVSNSVFSDVVATVINGVLQLPTNPLYTF
jgi:hypothetical protein